MARVHLLLCQIRIAPIIKPDEIDLTVAFTTRSISFSQSSNSKTTGYDVHPIYPRIGAAGARQFEKVFDVAPGVGRDSVNDVGKLQAPLQGDMAYEHVRFPFARNRCLLGHLSS